MRPGESFDFAPFMEAIEATGYVRFELLGTGPKGVTLSPEGVLSVPPSPQQYAAAVRARKPHMQVKRLQPEGKT